MSETQKSLLVCDAFKAQSTAKVMDRLSKVDIDSVMIRKIMTHLLQLLDLTTNAAFEKYKKLAFSEYLSARVMVALKNDPACDVMTVKVDLHLSTLKPYYTNDRFQTKGKQ